MRRSRASRPRCVIISRPPSSAPIRATLPTCTRAWSARSGRHFRSASLCARPASISPVTISGANRPASPSASSSAARKKNEVTLSWTIQSPTHCRSRRATAAGQGARLRQFQHQGRLSADAGLRSRTRAHGHGFRPERLSLVRRQYQLRSRHRDDDGAEARRSRPQGSRIAAAAQSHPRLSNAEAPRRAADPDG